MTRNRTTDARNPKPTRGVVIAGFLLITLLCKVDVAAAQGCSLLDNTAWVALQALRPVLQLSDWRAVLTYLCEGARVLQHALQIGEFLCELLRVVAG